MDLEKLIEDSLENQKETMNANKIAMQVNESYDNGYLRALEDLKHKITWDRIDNKKEN